MKKKKNWFPINKHDLFPVHYYFLILYTEINTLGNIFYQAIYECNVSQILFLIRQCLVFLKQNIEGCFLFLYICIYIYIYKLSKYCFICKIKIYSGVE